MTTQDLPQIDSADLKTTTSLHDGELHVRFRGTADVRSMSALESLLASVHETTKTSGAKSVAIDFRELDFMNSSCFKAFVSWLAEVQEQPEGAQYRIRFLSDPSKHWQKRSLNALKCFAVDLVSVEV